MSAAAMAEAMRKAGCSIEQIIEALREFEEGKKAKGREGNRRRQAEFRARRNEGNANNACNTVMDSNGNNGVTSVTGVTQPDSPRARVLCGEESIIKKPSPSGEGKKVSSKSKRAKSRLAENWKLDEIDLGYARQCGMTEPEARLEAEKFKNRHDSVGSLMADWRAAWRTWCGNWQTWRKPNGRPQTPNVLPFGPDPPRREFSDAEKREAAERWKQELAKQATQ